MHQQRFCLPVASDQAFEQSCPPLSLCPPTSLDANAAQEPLSIGLEGPAALSGAFPMGAHAQSEYQMINLSFAWPFSNKNVALRRSGFIQIKLFSASSSLSSRREPVGGNPSNVLILRMVPLRATIQYHRHIIYCKTLDSMHLHCLEQEICLHGFHLHRGTTSWWCDLDWLKKEKSESLYSHRLPFYAGGIN